MENHIGYSEHLISMAKETVAKETVNTYVFDRSHKKVKGFAGLRGVDVPEAYEMLVTAGLKSMGYDPSTFK